MVVVEEDVELSLVEEGGEEVGERICPYHSSCTRTPLEGWTARCIEIITHQ